jgi:hypothetical protein
LATFNIKKKSILTACMPLINKKGIESENRTTIGHWSVERRQKGINKPKRGYCFTMEQTSFGRMESFSFLYI